MESMVISPIFFASLLFGASEAVYFTLVLAVPSKFASHNSVANPSSTSSTSVFLNFKGFVAE
ncbi:MAG: hypothetical protein CME64_06040 [Halobacteriovoraceae bacterium]|nr:hypothetical protein [Halobacteriovoraceae bacterium]